MKCALPILSALLILCLLTTNCLCMTAFGAESTENMDIEEQKPVPATGDSLLIRLKLAGMIVIASACMLLFLNHRKWI